MKRLWLLDLDNTLYPAGSGLFELVNERISRYMAERLEIAEEAIPALRDRYWKTYGLTMGGLVAHHGVDPEEYLAYVHDVPLDRFLRPDPELARALDGLPGEKVIFTNGSAGHARAVLEHLGIREVFAGICDIAYMDYVPKPRPHGYRKVLLERGADPANSWMVDDSAENLETARVLGLTTVLVGPGCPNGHLHVARPHELLPLFLARSGATESAGR